MSTKLAILSKDGTERAYVEKWKFFDGMMQEQYVMCNIRSEQPIPFTIGDYCMFRGQQYILTYVPTSIQHARKNTVLDAFQYNDVKFISIGGDELSRCIMLDITSSTSAWHESLGTNYTGSSVFPLFCGSTSFISEGQVVTRPSVCSLIAKIQVNLDRMYGQGIWTIHIDTEHISTKDHQLSFNNTTVMDALADVYNIFKLNYCIRSRDIYIGYDMTAPTIWGNLTDYYLGYGHGFPTQQNPLTGLFEIERTADSSQKIVTRLRVLGSSKNLPYRYYNKRYNLSQALFPLQLQLPDTFLPEGNAQTENTKEYNNTHSRAGMNLRKVRGATNDSYIDKNDNAATCEEGIREECVRFDGSDSKLEEIYPTIEGNTYEVLRAAGLPDQDGNTGDDAFPNYDDDELIDRLLLVEDDANIGDGILSSDQYVNNRVVDSGIEMQQYRYIEDSTSDDFEEVQEEGLGTLFEGTSKQMFIISNVDKGKYSLAPVIESIWYSIKCDDFFSTVSAIVSFKAGYIMTVEVIPVNNGETSTYRYISDTIRLDVSDDSAQFDMHKFNEIEVSAKSSVKVSIQPYITDITWSGGLSHSFWVGWKVGSAIDAIGNDMPVPQYVLVPFDNTLSQNKPFHIYIKDMGFELSANFNGDTPVIHMKSGECVGREFEIGSEIEKVIDSETGKKGYRLTLNRASDSSLNTYYPNGVMGGGRLMQDDEFVITGIDLPSAYVDMAEIRLLRAATAWLTENSDTKFTYRPQIDEIFVQRDYDRCLSAGDESDSILYRLYAGLKLPFQGIPDSPDGEPAINSVMIEQVTITMGEGLVPKIEIKLNDNIQQSTINRLTNSIEKLNDEIYRSTINDAGRTDTPVYIQAGKARPVTDVKVPGQVVGQQGVSAKGIADFTVYGAGGRGTYNYEELENKPQINGHKLEGNKSASDLGLASADHDHDDSYLGKDNVASNITASNTGHADTFAVEGVTLNASTLSHCRYVITFTQAPSQTDSYGRVNLTLGGFTLPIVYEGGYASSGNKWQAGDTMDVWYQSGAWHLQRANYPHLSYEVWGTIEKISNPFNRN